MAEAVAATVQLSRIQRRLSSWREQHGGRGRPIPEELWSAAAGVAAVEGVTTTARALGVDRERLARRVQERSATCHAAASAQTALTSTGFVEVDTRRVFARGQTVVRLTSRDCEQLEIAMEVGARWTWRRWRVRSGRP